MKYVKKEKVLYNNYYNPPQESHLIEYEVSSHNISFKIWKISRWKHQDGKTGIYFVDEASSGDLGVDDREKAMPFMTGNLKWDGCCNIDFPSVREGEFPGPMHFCGPEKNPEIGFLMKEMYHLGPEMEAWRWEYEDDWVDSFPAANREYFAKLKNKYNHFQETLHNIASSTDDSNAKEMAVEALNYLSYIDFLDENVSSS